MRGVMPKRIGGVHDFPRQPVIASHRRGELGTGRGIGVGREGERRARIGVDGYNLALEQGTGIATYSRNLTYVLKRAGAQVDIVYGRNIPARGVFSAGRRAEGDLLQEIGFFDPGPQLELNLLSGAQAAIRSLWPLRASEIPISGAVAADDFHDRLPAFDRILNRRNLFVLAYNHFHVWGRLLRLHLPDPPQLMHWTYPIPAEVVGAKNIYTFHDLIPLRLPHTTLDHKRRYLSMVRLIARRADHIVTVSEASRADIQRLLAVPDANVTNTFQSVDLAAAPADETERRALRRSFGMPEDGYFLFFGAIEPKKNVGRLIEGFLAAETRAPLLIVGKKAWKAEGELRLLPLAHQLQGGLHGGGSATGGQEAGRSKGPRILHLDYVPQSVLISLIRGAKAVVFPSIYEGFGLPVLEAMQLGVPVITSDRSSLPEVAGDAALIVNPYDTRAIAEAVRRMDADAVLRAQLAARGLQRAAKFSSSIYDGELKVLYNRLGVNL